MGSLRLRNVLEEQTCLGRHTARPVTNIALLNGILNNSPLKREGFDLAEAFLLGGCPRFAVTSTTKSFLTQPLYGEGRNPAPSEPPELTLSDPFSGFNDYDTGVKPGCYSG